MTNPKRTNPKRAGHWRKPGLILGTLFVIVLSPNGRGISTAVRLTVAGCAVRHQLSAQLAH
jgi:hypothetical protein